MENHTTKVAYYGSFRPRPGSSGHFEAGAKAQENSRLEFQLSPGRLGWTRTPLSRKYRHRSSRSGTSTCVQNTVSLPLNVPAPVRVVAFRAKRFALAPVCGESLNRTPNVTPGRRLDLALKPSLH